MIEKVTRRRMLIICLLALSISVSSCVNGVGEIDLASEVDLPGQAEDARFLSNNLPSADYSRYSIDFNDVGDLAVASDLVFVGEILGTRSKVLLDGPYEDTPDETIMEYDGILFKITEVLVGQGTKTGAQVIVAHPAVISINGTEKKVSAEPIETVRSGLEAVARAEQSPRYLVFATVEGGLAFFNSPGGVVEVGLDGSLGEAAGVPFLSVEYEGEVFEHALSLDVVRDWIEGNPPKREPPAHAVPDPNAKPPATATRPAYEDPQRPVGDDLPPEVDPGDPEFKGEFGD